MELDCIVSDQRIRHTRAVSSPQPSSINVSGQYMQHRFATIVDGRLRAQRRTRKWLAQETGLDYTRLGRLLNGHLPMRLSDMGVIGIALDIAIPFKWAEEEPR